MNESLKALRLYTHTHTHTILLDNKRIGGEDNV